MFQMIFIYVKVENTCRKYLIFKKNLKKKKNDIVQIRIKIYLFTMI